MPVYSCCCVGLLNNNHFSINVTVVAAIDDMLMLMCIWGSSFSLWMMAMAMVAATLMMWWWRAARGCGGLGIGFIEFQIFFWENNIYKWKYIIELTIELVNIPTVCGWGSKEGVWCDLCCDTWLMCSLSADGCSAGCCAVLRCDDQRLLLR